MCVCEGVVLCLALPFLLFRNAILMVKSDSAKHSVKAWPPQDKLARSMAVIYTHQSAADKAAFPADSKQRTVDNYLEH